MTTSTNATPPRPFRLALFGAGRVGTSVARSLKDAGNEVVGILSRTRASAEKAAVMLDAPVVDGDLPAGTDVVLIGVTAPHIEDTAHRIARWIRPGMVAWHFAGALGVAPLGSVVAAGGGACAGHPVQAIPDAASGIARLPGSAWGLTTSPGLEEWAAGIVASDLRGTPVAISEDARVLWHAAAVTASNGISAALAISEAILALAGIPGAERILGPLAAGTVANAREGGGGAATLTGPVVRGEKATIATHIGALRDALRERPPADAHVGLGFATLVRTIMHAAVASGRISERELEAMIEDLEAAWRS